MKIHHMLLDLAWEAYSGVIEEDTNLHLRSGEEGRTYWDNHEFVMLRIFFCIDKFNSLLVYISWIVGDLIAV